MNETRLLLMLVGVVIVIVVVAGVRVVPVKLEGLRCAAFHTQGEAQRAYRAGATWLDSDGDHLACEALP